MRLPARQDGMDEGNLDGTPTEDAWQAEEHEQVITALAQANKMGYSRISRHLRSWPSVSWKDIQLWE